MTIDEALARLDKDWVLGRGFDYDTDEPGWVVHDVDSGELLQRLGWGATPLAAIEAAEIKIAQDEREEAERRADYERRKAAGELTEWEIASEKAGAIWAPVMVEALNQMPTFASLANRTFEGEIIKQGATIKINPVKYRAFEIEKVAQRNTQKRRP